MAMVLDVSVMEPTIIKSLPLLVAMVWYLRVMMLPSYMCPRD